MASGPTADGDEHAEQIQILLDIAFDPIAIANAINRRGGCHFGDSGIHEPLLKEIIQVVAGDF